MKKSVIIGIIITVVVLVIVAVFIIYTGKECKTDTDCLAKTCFTSQCSDNKCVYSPIANCCGNEICEVGETYLECAVDCPNCDDDNECTKDSYDYHEQKCVSKIIIPCCGNDICDENAETYSTCSKDCPNCDDNGKLTADSFNYKTQKCENIVTHYFIDDFEGDIKNWDFSGEGNWSTAVEDDNTVLKLTGYMLAHIQKERDNYAFKFRFKRIEGSMHVNFRKSSTKEGQNRYIVAIHPGEVGSLGEQLGKSFQKLKEIGLRFDKNWHTLEIRGYNDILNVYMDNELLVKYKDTENPFLSGRAGFEIHTGGAPITPEFLIDDVEIKLIEEEDIIYP